MIKNAFGPNPKSVENTAVAYSSVPNNNTNNNFKSPKRNEVIVIDSVNENEQTKRIIDFGNASGPDNMRQQLTRIVRNKRQMESPAQSNSKITNGYVGRDMIFTQMGNT
jgi:hypothetical protein